MNDDLQELSKIVGKAFRKAKRWYLAYLACQFCVLVLAVIFIFVQMNPNTVAVTGFLAILAAECLRWNSDYWKSHGEWAKRMWEMVDGLGVRLDGKDVADWLAARPRGFLMDVTSDEMQGSEFDSHRAKGPVRVVENTRESAWWSKHESQRMVALLATVLALVVLASFVALILSIASLSRAEAKQSGSLAQNIGVIVCSVLGFVVSVNLMRLLADFHMFASNAENIFRRCDRALESPSLEECDALSIMHDYQVARNSAPLLPTFIWRLRRAHLREQWARLRPKVKARAPGR
jgi:hypothetical protein